MLTLLGLIPISVRRNSKAMTSSPRIRCAKGSPTLINAAASDLRTCEQEEKITEADLQPQKPLWHEDTRGPRRSHPQNLVLTDAAQRMVHFNVQVCIYAIP